MLLGRWVSQRKCWFDSLANQSSSVSALKPESLSDFIPSQDDKGWLSVYEMNEEGDEELIAAALAYNMGMIEAFHFVVADSSMLEEAGVAIKQTDGLTFHPNVNKKHFEIEILDTETLLKVVEAFQAGQYRPVENPVVRKKLGESAMNDNIDFDEVCKKKVDGKVAVRTLELVRDKYLKIGPNSA